MGPVRVVAACTAAGALAGSLVFSLLWLVRPESYWFVLITSYTPYALPGYLVALAALLVLLRGSTPPYRRWVAGATALAAFGAALHVGLLLPAYVGEHPDGPADLTVLTLNTRRGGADAAAIVARVRDRGARVVVLEEVTPQLQERLQAAGLPGLLPEVAGAAGPDTSGILVYSAYPLAEVAVLPLGHGSYRVRVAAPTPFWLLAVRLAQPLENQGSAWRGDWSVLRKVIGTLDGSVVVAGDFNSTLEHRSVRALLADGFADAARQSNAGWQPTYPSGYGLIAIDHVLVRGDYAAVRTRTEAVPGTDHRALVAALATSGGARK